ncbi:MAG: WecB/TagA/CpsF family glycosyltransferase [Candidatus Omnitrophota bacterium]|nr:MAG: WecB/TagA/CpsF family glycosyltransferase [Candidatus Omnitrophota bacterium]
MSTRDLCSILGIGIDRLTVSEVLEKVKDFVREKGPHEIFYVNADCINRSFLDENYRRIIKNADLVYPDGMGVVWTSRYTDNPLPERVNLGDFMPKLCNLCQKQDFSIFILAGAEGVAEKAARNLRKNFPKLRIAGTHHGYFSDDEEERIIEKINNSNCDILLVGMGVPKQEEWIDKNKYRLNVPVLWGVGALFDYYSLRLKRAPVWVRRLGLEWLFRLILEPSRLWRRYMLGNIFFIWRIFLLLLVDALFVSLAWIGAYWFRYSLNDVMPYPINPFNVYLYALPFVILLWVVTCAYFNLYIPKWGKTKVALELSSIIKAVIMGLLIAMSLSFLLRELEFGRSVILLWGIFSFVLLLLSRIVVRSIDAKKERLWLLKKK